MRVIKFRGKQLLFNDDNFISNQDNNCWLFGNLITDISHIDNNTSSSYIIQDDISSILLNPRNNIINYFDKCKVCPKTIGQFTGFKDSNNIEIYEGDIIEVRHLNRDILIGIGIVWFKNSRWEVEWINEDNSNIEVRNDLDFISEKRIPVVIDNIHDNLLALINSN